MARQKQTKIDSITKALILVAHGSTLTEASQECGIARSTLSKAINQDSEIQAILNSQREQYRAEVIEDINSKTKRIFDKALDTIDQALDSEATPIKDKTYIALTYIGKIATALAKQTEAEQKAEETPQLPKIVIHYTDDPKDYEDTNTPKHYEADENTVVYLPDNGRG